MAKWVALLFVGFLAALALTPLGVGFGNGFSMLHRDGFFIPKESSIWSFRETVPDEGSGGYWLYGQDSAHFYTSLKRGGGEPYRVISRLDAVEVEGFDPLEAATWQHVSQIYCADLLAVYAAPVDGLEFVDCARGENVQVIVSARYRVPGGKSAEVEAVLVDRYGLGPLRFVCCGYESSGYGGFTHEDLTRIDPYLSGSISMSGSDFVVQPEGADASVQLPEFDRGAIEYFYVTVEILLV